MVRGLETTEACDWVIAKYISEKWRPYAFGLIYIYPSQEAISRLYHSDIINKSQMRGHNKNITVM